jgi:hypothetical protein
MIELPDWAIDIVGRTGSVHPQEKSTLDNIRKVGHSDLPTHDQEVSDGPEEVIHERSTGPSVNMGV